MSEEPKAARGWFTEFRRRRMFRAMVAYLVGAWLLLQVANVTFPPLGVPDWVQRAMIIALAIGIVPAFVLAWIFDLTVHGIVRTDAVVRADAESAHAADADASFHPLPRTAAAEQPGPAHAVAASAQPETGASVAILPFADLSAAKDQDWFCDGLAEEIIDALSCVRGLRVASRTASFRFRDGSVDPREIGTQLRVGAILEGSVRKSGDQLRITAQLIDAVSGFHLWSETFDRRLEDVFAIQSEIARRVSAALRVSLTGEVAARRALRNAQYARARVLPARSPARAPGWRAGMAPVAGDVPARDRARPGVCRSARRPCGCPRAAAALALREGRRRAARSDERGAPCPGTGAGTGRGARRARSRALVDGRH
jgi:TolB-like protein